MAESIASLAQWASSLQGLATTLDHGARGGVSRNESLRSLAAENRPVSTRTASLKAWR